MQSPETILADTTATTEPRRFGLSDTALGLLTYLYVSILAAAGTFLLVGLAARAWWWMAAGLRW